MRYIGLDYVASHNIIYKTHNTAKLNTVYDVQITRTFVTDKLASTAKVLESLVANST